MNTQLARILSATLHPLLMPTILFGIIFYAAPEAIPNLDTLNQGTAVDLLGIKISIKLGLVLLIFNFTFLLPAYLIYVLYRFGAIQSLEMQTLKDRRQPYLITTLVYTLICLFFAFRLGQLPELTLILMSITLCIAAVTVISLYWKISAHSVGISGMLGAVMGLLLKLGVMRLFYPMLILMVIAGFLLSARLYLNAHTPNQVMAGFALGLFISLLTILVFV